jgi:hypothetical protein
MILECIPRHTQDSPLIVNANNVWRQSQPARCGMARCSLAGAAARLSQSSFHLATRNPKELVGMVDAWQRFSTAFAEPLRRANLVTDRVQQLGHRGAACQVHLDQVSPGPMTLL